MNVMGMAVALADAREGEFTGSDIAAAMPNVPRRDVFTALRVAAYDGRIIECGKSIIDGREVNTYRRRAPSEGSPGEITRHLQPLLCGSRA